MKMRPSLFRNVSAGEILFDGFSDPLLTVGSLFAAPGSFQRLCKDCSHFFIGGIPMDKFGWFYERNGTTWSDGVLTMDTGTDDIAKLGDIRQEALIADFNSLNHLTLILENGMERIGACMREAVDC